MTRSEAIEILIAVAVCDRPILSCDFCARYKGTGNGCDEPTDKEVEEAVLLLKGASNDAAISALRQEDHFREVTKKVEPLTLEELRKMDGEPVYIVDGDLAWWDIVSFSVQDWLYLARGEELRYSRYGEWLAYRQKT